MSWYEQKGTVLATCRYMNPTVLRYSGLWCCVVWQLQTFGAKCFHVQVYLEDGGCIPHDTLTIAYQTLKYHSLDCIVDFHPCDNHKSDAAKFEFIYISGERLWHRLPVKCFCVASLQYFLYSLERFLAVRWHKFQFVLYVYFEKEKWSCAYLKFNGFIIDIHWRDSVIAIYRRCS